MDVDLLSSFGDDDEEEEEGSSSAAAETSVSASSNSGESSSRAGGGAQAQAPLESLKEGVAFSPYRQQPRRKSSGRMRAGRSDREEEEEGFMSLVEASLEGDVTAVREALERGEKVRTKDVDGRDAVLAVVLGSDKAR